MLSLLLAICTKPSRACCVCEKRTLGSVSRTVWRMAMETLMIRLVDCVSQAMRLMHLRALLAFDAWPTKIIIIYFELCVCTLHSGCWSHTSEHWQVIPRAFNIVFVHKYRLMNGLDHRRPTLANNNDVDDADVSCAARKWMPFMKYFFISSFLFANGDLAYEWRACKWRPSCHWPFDLIYLTSPRPMADSVNNTKCISVESRLIQSKLELKLNWIEWSTLTRRVVYSQNVPMQSYMCPPHRHTQNELFAKFYLFIFASHFGQSNVHALSVPSVHLAISALLLI